MRVYTDQMEKQKFKILFSMRMITRKIQNFQSVTPIKIHRVGNHFHKIFQNNPNHNIQARNLLEYPHNYHKIQNTLKIGQKDQFRKVIIKANNITVQVAPKIKDN